jgi:hypothetical protein
MLTNWKHNSRTKFRPIGMLNDGVSCTNIDEYHDDEQGMALTTVVYNKNNYVSIMQLNARRRQNLRHNKYQSSS